MAAPFDRRPDESQKAYAAFRAYCEMGAERSLARLPQIIGKPSGYSRWLEEWSRLHEWQVRVRAWDAAEQARRDEQRIRDDRKEYEQERKARKALLWATRQVVLDEMGRLRELRHPNPDPAKRIVPTEDEAKLSQQDITNRMAYLWKTARSLNEESREEFDDLPAQRHAIETNIPVGDIYRELLKNDPDTAIALVRAGARDAQSSTRESGESGKASD